MHATDLFDLKYQLLIKKREKAGLNDFEDQESFIQYLSGMQDVYSNIEECNLGKKRKNVIVFDEAIRGRKPDISLAFITKSKDVRLNTTHFFIMKISNR